MPVKRIKYAVPKVKLTTYSGGRQRPTTTSVPLASDSLVAGGMSNPISDVMDGVCVSGSEYASLVNDDDVAEVDYYQRKHKEVSDWAAIRNDVFVAEVSRNVPWSSTCTQCGQVVEKPIRCGDCGPFTILCNHCEVKQHAEKHLLHRPEIWEVIVVLCSSP